MKTLFLATALSAFSASALAGGVYVSPHIRSDGTFVQGHYRSAPNSTMMDNYSTQGNVNPYTGQPGYIAPAPAYNPIPLYRPIKPIDYIGD